MKVLFVYFVIIIIGYIRVTHKIDELALFAFIFFLPFKNMLLPNEVLLGRIGPDNLATFILIIIIILSGWKKYPPSEVTEYYRFLFWWMIIFMYIIPYYINIKGEILGISLEYIQTYQVIRDISFIIALAYTFNQLADPKKYNVIFNALMGGYFLAGLSTFAPDFIGHLGLNSTNYFSVVERSSGLLFLNPNAAGGYFAFCLGITLAIIKYYQNVKKINYLLIIVCIVLFGGVLGTGSRTGLICSMLVVAFFLADIRILEIHLNKYILIIFILVGMYCMYLLFGQITQNRMIEAAETQGGSLQSRFTHWQIYISELKEHPNYILMGNRTPINYAYNVHNHYLYLLYHAGILSFILYILFYIKLFNKHSSLKPKSKRGPVSYAIVAILIGGITGVQLPNPIAFVALSMLAINI